MDPGSTLRFARDDPRIGSGCGSTFSQAKKNGTLYVGVTNHPSRRVAEHRDGRGSQFAGRYGVTRLVYAEHHDDPAEAIAQEKRIKRWSRDWKIALIERANPDWNDLYPTTHLD